MSHGNNEGEGGGWRGSPVLEGIGAGRVEGDRADGGWCEARGKRGVGRARVPSSRVDRGRVLTFSGALRCAG